ncbi:MAG TPA: hypothetical protein VKB86_04395 [Pyrinomonadaceae bacterium]|nr:hypothetical protein [Pyrinomonadaceae bacterium]
MSQSTREPLSDKDQIQILLHEYGTLRTEVIHRSNNLYQLLTVGGVLFVWLMGHPIDRRFWITLGLAVPLLCSGFWVIRRYTNKLSKRLREIEKRVNSLAGVELLVWETLWGAAVTRYFALRTSPITEFFQATLRPDQAMRIDCPNIDSHTNTHPGTFIEGFVVIQSPSELDVVAVYTAGGDHVETLATERVQARRVQ